ncbi:MAG: glycoside hydrolase family 5 protein [Treponema sp.]|nr:glycoside hydrolase family 5 protein [Treponema sp.]MEE3434896.1 glycoside hydrolase family 5 protein [Treponema sp.]
MKKTNLFAITTLLLLGAIFFSCSNSSGGPQGQPQEQPQVQPRPNVTLNASLSALDIAQKMECGWNLGNSLDYRLCDGNYPCNYGLGAETAWGEVLTTEQIIKTGIQNGYKTIRIPVTWFNHLVDGNYTIDPQWMARVKQVVNWAIDAGYYVILDEHHSVRDEIEKPLQRYAGYNIRRGDEEETKRFLEAVWKQIAAAFNNEYDEHLIFETLNEPRNIGHKVGNADHEWSPVPDSCEECKANVQLLKECNQLILNTIRSSGGNNANRCVMVPALGSQLQPALDLGLQMLPTDSASGKIMATVHWYPLDAGNTGHYSHHFDSATKNSIKSKMEELNQKFVSHGIPVVIGEYGAARKAYDWNTNQPIADYVVTYQDRLECFSYLASFGGKYSVPLLNWDADNKWGTGSNTIDRKTCSLVEPECVAAIITAWKEKSWDEASLATITELSVGSQTLPSSGADWGCVEFSSAAISAAARGSVLKLNIEKIPAAPYSQIRLCPRQNSSGGEDWTSLDMGKNGGGKDFCAAIGESEGGAVLIDAEPSSNGKDIQPSSDAAVDVYYWLSEADCARLSTGLAIRGLGVKINSASIKNKK